MDIRLDGAALYPGFLTRDIQLEILDDIRTGLASAPLFRPVMPGSGKPLSVRMSNFGSFGWVSDKSGYRYQAHHPVTGRPWPTIPDSILKIWNALLPEETYLPDACLINFYDADARMGLHQDNDEHDLTLPVLSISLGDEAIFRLGGKTRTAPTQSIRLKSGDAFILKREDRLSFHGIDRIIPDSSTLLKNTGRINLTLRRSQPLG